MDFKDLVGMYEAKKKQFGKDAYLHVSEIYEEARGQYKKEYAVSPRAQKKIAQGKAIDAEQSWKAFKGKSFEKLIWYIINDEFKNVHNLRCILGTSLAGNIISKELSQVYYNLTIRFGKWALLPDVDLIIYEPKTYKIIGVVSCKITLRERIAQTAYWKLKLANDPLRMHIKGYFVTTDEDSDLVKGISNPSRNRIIVEHELDGTYSLRAIEESNKVKLFPKFIDELRRLIDGQK